MVDLQIERLSPKWPDLVSPYVSPDILRITTQAHHPVAAKPGGNSSDSTDIADSGASAHPQASLLIHRFRNDTPPEVPLYILGRRAQHVEHAR